MSEDGILILILLGCMVGYVLGTLLGYWFGRVYNVYKVYLLHWQDRTKMAPETIPYAWNCYEPRRLLHSQLDNFPAWTMFWIFSIPLSIFILMPLRLMDALWVRYITPAYVSIKKRNYRLLPSWVSWSKLTEILNRTI